MKNIKFTQSEAFTVYSPILIATKRHVYRLSSVKFTSGKDFVALTNHHQMTSLDLFFFYKKNVKFTSYDASAININNRKTTSLHF